MLGSRRQGLEVEELQWGTRTRVKVFVSMPFVAVLTGAVLAVALG